VVFFFYIGIALTISYSLVLLRALAGHGTSPSVLIPRFGLSAFSRVPILWLSTLSVLTGSALFFQVTRIPSMLSWCDAILVYGYLIVGGVQGIASSRVPNWVCSPHLFLFASTSYFRCLTQPGSTFQATEVGCIHGFGLSVTPAVIVNQRAGWVVTSKALIILGLVVLLA